jgi:FixJ family two-component response regulator
VPSDQRADPLRAEGEIAPPIVCVIDDDVSLLRALKRLLKVRRFSVTTFASAEEFLESASREEVACLVLDVYLEGLSGFGLQKQLAAEGSRIPVLFITGRDDPSTRERARQAGAVDYLRKPLDEEVLLAAIHWAVDC